MAIRSSKWANPSHFCGIIYDALQMAYASKIMANKGLHVESAASADGVTKSGGADHHAKGKGDALSITPHIC